MFEYRRVSWDMILTTLVTWLYKNNLLVEIGPQLVIFQTLPLTRPGKMVGSFCFLTFVKLTVERTHDIMKNVSLDS